MQPAGAQVRWLVRLEPHVDARMQLGLVSHSMLVWTVRMYVQLPGSRSERSIGAIISQHERYALAGAVARAHEERRRYYEPFPRTLPLPPAPRMQRLIGGVEL